MRDYILEDEFLTKLKKLDNSVKNEIVKKIEKVVANPELGKPLHSPLKNNFSKRSGKHRLIYKYNDERVTFVYLEHRDKVYE